VQTVYYSPAGELNNVSFSAMCFEAGDSVLATLAQNRGAVIKLDAEKKQSCNAVLLDKYTLHQLTTTRYLADGTLNKAKPLNISVSLYGGINYDEIPSMGDTISAEMTNEDYALQLNLSKSNQNAERNRSRGKQRSSSSYGKKMDLLPGTKEEVSNISNLVAKDQWKVQTRSDNQAGEYQFKKELENNSPGVLHIATHGFAFPDEAKKEMSMMSMEKESTYKVSEDPMVRCGLMLGGSNISWTGNPQKMIEQTGDDGILTAAEVANLDLSNTKLVVLSACETGLGKIEGSEGTFGLKRGFKLAGVEQMIVSLWSVPDKETMELMTLFYSDLTKSLNPVISFEKSQKEMRNKYPTDPEKWAGFVLVR
jgi:CHAT domain-containing protein